MISTTTATTTTIQSSPSKNTGRPEHPSPRNAPTSKGSKLNDFFWTYTEEPHRTRRQAIIKAHPEVLKLCGPEPLTKYVVLGVVALQITLACLFRETSILSWQFLVTAYIVGATANQNLFLAIHEISHNLAFKSPLANRIGAVFANLPIGIPYSAAFRPYHLTHHKSLGVDGLDTDLPTAAEAFFLDSVLGKAFFCTFQILFYALRPMMVYQIPLTKIHAFNIVAQVGFDVGLVWATGSFRPLVYLLFSSFLAGSLHPCAGHFIAEHYVLQHSSPTTGMVSGDVVDSTSTDSHQNGNGDSTGQGIEGQNQSTKTMHVDVPTPEETYSYYGPLNIITYNVGYHNEHHDFPAVPWTKLPALHTLAKGFYVELPHHRSWVAVMWQFIWDEGVGLKCRVKRLRSGGMKAVGGGK